MKTTNDAPKEYTFNERRAWKIGYNQCLIDHEYMDTNAKLRALLSEANIALKRCCLVISGEEMTKRSLIESLETGKKMITEIDEVLK